MSEPTIATTAETPPGAPSGGTPPSLRGPGVAGTLLHRFRGFGGALAALLVMVVYLSVTQEFFATKANILNVLSGNSAMMITAIGLTFIVLSAGFDLSVGAIVALAGVWCTTLATQSYGAGGMIFSALTVGLAVGVVNGLLISYGRLVPFIATLAMMVAARGLAAEISDARP